MAVVLESITVPRASMFRTSSSIMAIAISDIHIARGNRSLSEFKGLKMKTSLPIRTLVSKRRSVRAVRGGKVVCEAQDTAVEVPDVTEDTWQSLVVENDLPVLVDFWAPWCGPCRMILPIISELSKQYAGKLKCYKMNTDEAPTTATRLGIRSIPTVIIFKKGEKKDAIIGAVPKSTLTASIDKFLER